MFGLLYSGGIRGAYRLSVLGSQEAEAYHARLSCLAYGHTKRASVGFGINWTARPHAYYGQHNRLLYDCASM